MRPPSGERVTTSLGSNRATLDLPLCSVQKRALLPERITICRPSLESPICIMEPWCRLRGRQRRLPPSGRCTQSVPFLSSRRTCSPLIVSRAARALPLASSAQRTGWRVMARSQSRMAPASSAVAARAPLAVKTTDLTGLSCPRRVRVLAGMVPVAAARRITLPSGLALACQGGEGGALPVPSGQVGGPAPGSAGLST